MPDINLRHLPETALAACWLYWRHNAGLLAHWKTHQPCWLEKCFLLPIKAFTDCTYGAAWWMMKPLMRICLQLSIMELYGPTTGLLNKTISGRRDWIVLVVAVHTYSKVNNFLSVCIFVYSWQTRVTVRPKVVVMFFPPTVEQKVLLYIHSPFLGPAREGTAKMHCATAVIWEVG